MCSTSAQLSYIHASEFPSLQQVVGWLGAQGLRPWRGEELEHVAEDHGLDGALLLSLAPRDILRVLNLPPTDQINLEALAAGLAGLRKEVEARPVDLWEYRIAHRRTAALLQSALILTPRLAIVYSMVWQGNIVVLLFGRRSVSSPFLGVFHHSSTPVSSELSVETRNYSRVETRNYSRVVPGLNRQW